MTNELVKILEAAKEHYDRSNMWFKQYQETDEESYWNMCESEEYAARGLLEAYEIMTGKKIQTYEIKKEMMILC